MDPDIGAVVVGWDPCFTYQRMVYASVCLRELPGCLFVATNTDSADTLGGLRMMPGTGGLVSAVQVGLMPGTGGLVLAVQVGLMPGTGWPGVSSTGGFDARHWWPGCNSTIDEILSQVASVRWPWPAGIYWDKFQKWLTPRDLLGQCCTLRSAWPVLHPEIHPGLAPAEEASRI